MRSSQVLVDDTRENIAMAESLGWHVLWFDYAQPEESVEQVRMALDMQSSTSRV